MARTPRQRRKGGNGARPNWSRLKIAGITADTCDQPLPHELIPTLEVTPTDTPPDRRYTLRLDDWPPAKPGWKARLWTKNKR